MVPVDLQSLWPSLQSSPFNMVSAITKKNLIQIILQKTGKFSPHPDKKELTIKFRKIGKWSVDIDHMGSQPIIAIKSCGHLFGDIWHMRRQSTPGWFFNLHQSPAVCAIFPCWAPNKKSANAELGKNWLNVFTKSRHNFHVNILLLNVLIFKLSLSSLSN